MYLLVTYIDIITHSYLFIKSPKYLLKIKMKPKFLKNALKNTHKKPLNSCPFEIFTRLTATEFERMDCMCCGEKSPKSDFNFQTVSLQLF